VRGGAREEGTARAEEPGWSGFRDVGAKSGRGVKVR
jgi:hypothetical protein